MIAKYAVVRYRMHDTEHTVASSAEIKHRTKNIMHDTEQNGREQSEHRLQVSPTQKISVSVCYVGCGTYN